MQYVCQCGKGVWNHFISMGNVRVIVLAVWGRCVQPIGHYGEGVPSFSQYEKGLQSLFQYVEGVRNHFLSMGKVIAIIFSV